MQTSMYRNIGRNMIEMRNPLPGTCAFTGHRPFKFPWRYDETDSRCLALKAALTRQISALAEEGVTDFFSGMAECTDCYCAQIVLGLRDKNPALRLHCVLPCREQADRWSAAARARYRSILGRADSVVYVSPVYYQGCMLARNRRLVESAAILLAVYNGELRGGTAATVRYAQRLGRRLIVLDPDGLFL